MVAGWLRRKRDTCSAAPTDLDGGVWPSEGAAKGQPREGVAAEGEVVTWDWQEG